MAGSDSALPAYSGTGRQGRMQGELNGPHSPCSPRTCFAPRPSRPRSFSPRSCTPKSTPGSSFPRGTRPSSWGTASPTLASDGLRSIETDGSRAVGRGRSVSRAVVRGVRSLNGLVGHPAGERRKPLLEPSRNTQEVPSRRAGRWVGRKTAPWISYPQALVRHEAQLIEETTTGVVTEHPLVRRVLELEALGVLPGGGGLSFCGGRPRSGGRGDGRGAALHEASSSHAVTDTPREGSVQCHSKRAASAARSRFRLLPQLLD